MPGPRVDHHEGAFLHVKEHAFRRFDPCEPIVDRPFKLPSIDQNLGLETKHIRYLHSLVLVILVAALPQYVPEENRPLPEIRPVINILRNEFRQVPEI